MYTLVMPVSGGTFAAQLGLLQLLTAAVPERPAAILGASGGGVAAVAALCGGWEPRGIARVAATLHHEVFARKWVASPPVSMAVGFFEGTLYREGTGFHAVLATYLSPAAAVRTEVWLLACNLETQKAALFCNRAAADARLPAAAVDAALVQCAPPVYLGGDLAALAAAMQASASIPTIVPPQLVGGVPHADGGLFYASPLTPLQQALERQAQRDGRLHLVYVSGCDLAKAVAFLSRPPADAKSSLLDTGFLAAGGLVRGQQLSDRLAALQLLQACGRRAHSARCPGTSANFALLPALWAAAARTFVEVFPAAPAGAPPVYSPASVDITGFAGPDVLRVMGEARAAAALRVSWVGPPRLLAELGFELEAEP